MYTVEIGRQFLKYYNEKTGNDYSALEFFEEEFFPVVFDAEDHLHLMHVHNSPFFQRIYKKDREAYPDMRDALLRKYKFFDSIEEVVAGEDDLGGNLGVGFMAKGYDGTTSGQVSNLEAEFSKSDILYSWIGGALGVGFGGGYDFLFESNKINWFLFKGWRYYREYLKQTPNFKGRQLETWNGLWINYGLQYSNDFDRAFNETTIGIKDHTRKGGSYLKLDRPDWIKQIFSLARYFGSKRKRELVYGYGYGQMNTTLGFLYFELGEVKDMADLFDQLVANDSELTTNEKIRIEDAYETFFSLERACEMGGIGVQALRPKDLRKYTIWTRNKNMKSTPDLSKKQKRIKFLTYITWIEAMLKNDETLQLSEEVAEALIEYEGGENRLKTRITAVENLWDSKSRQQLIDKLSAIVKEEPKIAETINRAVDQLMTKIPQDMYKLFLTLIKFKYHYYQSN
ncbi:MAG TPA: hypothetical protein VJ964_05065 [Balneolaceae bacterium]|nr:hypothetical protein [Balneolaceae bacterium]